MKQLGTFRHFYSITLHVLTWDERNKSRVTPRDISRRISKWRRSTLEQRAVTSWYSRGFGWGSTTITTITTFWIWWSRLVQSTLGNSNLPLTRSNFISLQIIFYIILLSITRTFFYFPWRFELSGVDCNRKKTNIFFNQSTTEFKLNLIPKF